jgi:thiosulfate/3-mercaptopyruvate sulfurtransferase
LKDEAGLREVFTKAGLDINRPVVASCGSGVTAGVVAFALAMLGRADAAVYDGSWTEWGARTDLPIETG